MEKKLKLSLPEELKRKKELQEASDKLAQLRKIVYEAENHVTPMGMPQLRVSFTSGDLVWINGDILIFLRTEGLHHIFRYKNSEALIAFTNQQLIGEDVRLLKAGG